MEYQCTVLVGDQLRPSRTDPDITWALLAELGDYTVEFVKWEPGTVYRDHSHQDTEWIYVISGDLIEGESTFGPRTLLTYPPGSQHQHLTTSSGVVFVLIWTGADRMAPVSQSPAAFEHEVLVPDRFRPSAHTPGSCGVSMCRLGDHITVKWVKWESGFEHRDHIHGEPEWILLLAGDLEDGGHRIDPCSLLCYPKGSRHWGLKTTDGAEFILIRAGREHETYL